MTDSDESRAEEGAFAFFRRRRLLKLGLLGGGLLLGGAGGLLALRGSAPAVAGLRTLSDHEYRTAAALARTLLPAGGEIAPGADDFDLARAFDAFLADEPPENVSDLKAALALLELGPLLFDRRLATFSNLDAPARLEHWRRAWVESESLTRRMASIAFRKFMTLVYYDQESVWPALGYPRPGVSLMAGAILDLSRSPPPSGLSVEVCVVGSGCGGATAAQVLAEAGHEVVVLEEGGDYTGRQLTQRDGAMYDQLYMERGGRATEDLSITILQGRVLGGGGVINASDVVPSPPEVLEHWRTRHGLAAFGAKALAPYQERALAELSASRIAPSQVNRANGLLRDGTEALGWKGEVMLHNRVGCAGLGTCLIGCPLNAKRNPRFVAIPAALAAGARFFTRARAVRIEGAQRELKTIHVRTLDPKGYHEQQSFTLQARHLILAANAVASAQLLLRSGIGNEHVGRHLSLQPQLPVVARFDEPVDAFRGIPQSYAVTEFETADAEHGLGGFRLEGIMGTPGIVATLLPFAGAAHKAAMRGYAHIAAALLLVPDLPTGRVLLRPSGRPRVQYPHAEEHKARLRQAVQATTRLYLAAGAREVIVPLARPLLLHSEAELSEAMSALSFLPATAPLISAHQQGGVRFAPSPKDGAADPEGRVYGARGVYVFDSSGFPSSASTHTMTPIMAISRYLAEQLLARL